MYIHVVSSDKSFPNAMPFLLTFFGVIFGFPPLKSRFENTTQKNTHADWFKIVFLLNNYIILKRDRDIELTRTVGEMMARAKIVYILMI